MKHERSEHEDHDAWSDDVRREPHVHHAEHDAQVTPDAHEGHDKHTGHSPEMFRDRFWVSLVLTLPILYFSEQIQIWLGYRAVAFPGVEWVNPVLGTILLLYGGLVFLQGARHELMGRQPGMMTLISLAIGVAYVYSMAVALGLPGLPFFWELATLIAIMLLGHWLEMASVQGASKALQHLASLVPNEAHRLEGDRVTDVPVAALQAGDRILVRPGEQIPADGVVVEGRSSVNEAFLTGESRPVPKEERSEVVAGAVNGEGALTVEVARTGEQTTLSQIQRLVTLAQSSRSRFQNLADRSDRDRAGDRVPTRAGVGDSARDGERHRDERAQRHPRAQPRGVRAGARHPHRGVRQDRHPHRRSVRGAADLQLESHGRRRAADHGGARDKKRAPAGAGRGRRGAGARHAISRRRGL